MGSSQNCSCCHRSKHLIISLLLLLVSILTQVRFMAEGRAISKQIDAAQKRIEEEKLMVVCRSQIGSTPPRCDRRCNSCAHCEAIQVPVTTQAQNRRKTHFSATRTVEYSRGDDVSNYKPMSWKCKCGNLIFNP